MKITTGRSISSGTISDPMRAVIDPDDNNHIFVSTWGNGLLEYENNNLIKQFTETNSPLQAAIAGTCKNLRNGIGQFKKSLDNSDRGSGTHKST